MSLTEQLLSKIEQSLLTKDLSDTLSQKGIVQEVKDGVATVSGLSDVKFSEIVQFSSGVKGLVLDLTEFAVGVLILGDMRSIKQGDTVQLTGIIFSIPVGRQYIGRVVDGLGEAIDGNGAIEGKELAPVEIVAPGVMARQ